MAYEWYNAPVDLLNGFMIDHKETLDNIIDYCFYEACLNNNADNIDKWNKIRDELFAASFANITTCYNHGKVLYNSIPPNPPRAPIHRTLFWDYFENDKTDFEKACFLFMHALKSILGPKLKDIKKITNLNILSRMDGKRKAVKAINDLSPKIRKYAKEYWLKKIKDAFQMGGMFDYAGLVFYGKHVRGCYYSFGSTIEEVILHAKLKSPQVRKQMLAEDVKDAEQNVMNDIREAIKQRQTERTVKK